MQARDATTAGASGMDDTAATAGGIHTSATAGGAFDNFDASGSADASTSADPTGGAGGETGTATPADASGDTSTEPLALSKEELVAKARAAGWGATTATSYDAILSADGNGVHCGSAAKYEWKDEYGDVAPSIPELEAQLFHGEYLIRAGAHRDALDQFDVEVAGPEDVKAIRAFADGGLHPVILANIELCKYNDPTPIQSYAIPALQLGYDVVATSQTGSGKTAAYLIPIISKLMGKAKKLAGPKPDITQAGYDPKRHRVKAEPLVLIVVPTRELAIQVFDEARRLCYRSMLRPCVAYGGLPMRDCLEDLGKGCDILIGTPGRLCDLMSKADVLTMGRVKFTVIDEADEMLNSDWDEEMRTLLISGDTNEDADHQYMMFSATFPASARKMARDYMADDHIIMRVGRFGSSHKNVRQEVIQVEHFNKRQAMYDLLFASEPCRTLVFCNSKHAVDLLDDFLYNAGLPTTSITSDRSQREREDSIRAFRTGVAPILIATGVSARGLDIKDVMHVINYDLPSMMHGGIDEYIHRIGRTARMGHKGLATSFFTDRDDDMADKLVKNLIDCACEVPEFLESYKPTEGEDIDWQDNSDDEAEPAGFGGDDADGEGAGSGWGNGTAAAADKGFKPAGGAAVDDAGW